jgi:thioredoxin-related protein
MNAKIIFPMILAALLGTARADEKFPVLKAGNETYTNVTVTAVSATDIFFTHSSGMGNVKIKNLSPDLQKHFGYDPKKAKDAEIKQAENKAKYQQQLLHQPDVHPPDLARNQPDTASTAQAVWRLDFPGALKQAQSENKLVLLDFTGSDWCPWCVKFDHDVLSTGKFNAYAGQKLELVKVDFPRHTAQPDEQRRANAALGQAFHVDGFPTYVLLNFSGKELGRQVGYQEGGPDAFIAELENFSKR